jgi:hypothetical protein
MTITIGKMNGKMVQIVKIADTVPFSNERGWVMVCFDFEQAERKKSYFKWMPASTHFEWVRVFHF